MKKNEILDLLEEKGIILLVGDEYHLTEKYKDSLITRNPQPKITSKKSPLLSSKNNTVYPDDVALQKGRSRGAALLEFCNVPLWADGPDGKYRLRSLDSDSITIIDNIVDNYLEFDSTSIIAVIKNYYQNVTTPKSFKNFAKYELLDMYIEHLQGNAIPDKSSNDKDNQQWG